jgi:tetratricopeptide (TPR) repeat protein
MLVSFPEANEQSWSAGLPQQPLFDNPEFSQLLDEIEQGRVDRNEAVRRLVQIAATKALTVGNITNSSGVAIGDGATATVVKIENVVVQLAASLDAPERLVISHRIVRRLLPPHRFVDREEQIQLLSRLRRHGGLVTIEGLVGIGKSALAAAFAAHEAVDDSAVLYVDALSSSDPAALIAAFEHRIGIPQETRAGNQPDSLEARARRVAQVLDQQEAIVILDHCDVLLDDSLRAVFAELCAPGHRTLIVGLAAAVPELVRRLAPTHMLRLTGLDAPATHALLQAHGLSVTAAEAAALAEALGGHPQALALLATLAYDRGVLPEALLQAGTVDHAAFLAQLETHVFQRIVAQLTDAQRGLLAELALVRQPIERQSLGRISRQAEWEAALIGLMHHFAVSSVGQRLLLQPVLRELAARRLRAPARNVIHERLAAMYHADLKRVADEDFVTAVLEAHHHYWEADDHRGAAKLLIDTWEQVLAHDRHADLLEPLRRTTESEPSPELFMALGRTYTAAGAFDDALESYRVVEVIAPAPALIFATRTEIGSIYKQQSKRNAALEVYQRALELCEQQIANFAGLRDSTEWYACKASVLHNMGMMHHYFSPKDLEQAAELYADSEQFWIHAGKAYKEDLALIRKQQVELLTDPDFRQYNPDEAHRRFGDLALEFRHLGRPSYEAGCGASWIRCLSLAKWGLTAS